MGIIRILLVADAPSREEDIAVDIRDPGKFAMKHVWRLRIFHWLNDTLGAFT